MFNVDVTKSPPLIEYWTLKKAAVFAELELDIVKVDILEPAEQDPKEKETEVANTGQLTIALVPPKL